MSANRKNVHVVLASRPGEDKEATENNFRFEETAYPDDPVEDSVLLVRNLYLSLDPALRCRLNEDTGVEYVKPWKIDETVDGFGGIGEVIVSRNPCFKAGDLVIPNFLWPWKLYFTVAAETVRKIETQNVTWSPTLYLSVFGLTGLTAYLGVKEKGHVVRGANQTMVVSAAAGSTGSFAGQIAKAMGCERVIGTCGSDAKVKCLTDELGFDAAINYKTESVMERLTTLCPNGIDIYFDNVGGEISNEIIRQMNENSHIILCGQIADYNKRVEYPPPIPSDISDILKTRNICRDRFLVLMYRDQFETATQALMEMYNADKIKVKETIETGLENAGKAFLSMMRGGNTGKQLLDLR
ncbi:prostaglandin reductase 2-like [Plakobranchus ocellatus]|uniref:15-oxoprostaglandin 13-reductase n=1 Tax=Plakobranchus ocellatus TaxID=259542 RepID=A0AAV4DVZ8_9GAST|nr:prostaglandin reductase 2-like [Plakobranchus ocellatus]